ncbi:hypothetical protein P7C70_g391, partial [Phenoliferia sp. Uapishka_3]
MNPPTPAGSFTKISHSSVYPAISPLEALAGSAAHFTGSVLITGSGRGIGRLAALNFARAGAPKIVITARSSDELDEVEKLIKNDPKCGKTEVVKVVADVLHEEAVAKLFKAAGDVEVLINNAGALETPAKIGASKADEWFRTWEVNVNGTYLPTRELLRCIEASPRSSPVTIINTSSIGSVVTYPGFSSYQPTKSAINRFTEFLHYEVGTSHAGEGDGTNLLLFFQYPETVRTFAYHPGGVMTKLSKAMGKFAEPLLQDDAELAGCYCLWLATQSSAEFLRGRYSSCNWDVTELVARKAEVEEKDLLFTVVAGVEPSRK